MADFVSTATLTKAVFSVAVYLAFMVGGADSGVYTLPEQRAHLEKCILLQKPGSFVPTAIIPPKIWANRYVVAIIYLILLLYIFVGIAVASNIFMMSIEVICSKTKKVYRTWDENGVLIREQRTEMVWSEAVANLTLISLGTSAPEILLAIIETATNECCLGALGPGTIVGSAAYNLMIITAVCIISVPAHTTKKIIQYRVFVTTSIFALFAYLWMWFVIQIHSKGRIDAWEAFLTLLFFPILVVVAWMAEKNCFMKEKVEEKFSIHEASVQSLTEAEARELLFHFYDEWDELLDEEGKLNPETVQKLYEKLKLIAELTDEEIATIIATKLIQYRRHSFLWYRIRALRALVAGQKTFPVVSDKLKEVMDILNDLTRENTGIRGDLRPVVVTPEMLKEKAVIDLSATCFAVPRDVRHFQVVVRRSGREDVTVFCKLESCDGTAAKNAYTPLSKEFAFEPYVMEQKILVRVSSDTHANKDSNFFVKLSLMQGGNNDLRACLGPMSIMEVVIMDLVESGEIVFEKKGQVETAGSKQVDLNVERLNGGEGLLRAKWVVEPGPNCTCVEALEGVLEFENGELKKVLQIPLKSEGTPTGTGEDERFDVVFVKVTGTGGRIGDNPRVTVAISPDAQYKLEVLRIMEMSEEVANKQCTIERQTYREQIISAYIVNGAPEEAKRATKMDVFLHFLCLPWKMILCFLPTPYALGGFACFICTLAVLGLMTALAGDFATIFGDLIGIPQVITGLTLVAIGTSLPDTFASRIAALKSPSADAAIGNIMGSNSVNVFLGLGLPWTLSVIFHWITMEWMWYDREYVPSHVILVTNSLPFIILVYTICAIMVQIVLILRRFCLPYGFAELGGPGGTKWLTGLLLVFGWIMYVIMSIAQAYQFPGVKGASELLEKFHFPLYNTIDYVAHFKEKFSIDVNEKPKTAT